MQTAPPLTGLVLTPEAIHWRAVKRVRSNRLPGKKAILEVSATVAVSAAAQAECRRCRRLGGGQSAGGARRRALAALAASEWPAGVLAAAIASATAVWAAVLHTVIAVASEAGPEVSAAALPARAAAVALPAWAEAAVEAAAVAVRRRRWWPLRRWRKEVMNHESHNKHEIIAFQS